MRCGLAALLLIFSGLLLADESVLVCYGYGCREQVSIGYSELRLQTVGDSLLAAVDAAEERKILAEVIGRMYAWAAEQSDIGDDRGGNFADAGRPGRMDCIDHSTSTTHLLAVLERRGNLRWHRVLAADVRYWAWIFPAHYSAVIEETRDDEAERFVVDSWFVDNGQPAVILPLADWKRGAGPDV